MAKPCLGCGLEIVDGIIRLSTGDQLCSDSGAGVYCVGGQLGVEPAPSTVAPSVVMRSSVANVTLAAIGDEWATPTAGQPTISFPANTDGCRSIVSKIIVDWSATIVLTSSSDLTPTCIPDCDPLPPARSIATVHTFYEASVDGGVTWTVWWSGQYSTMLVYGSNFHEQLTIPVTISPGGGAFSIMFRQRFAAAAPHSGWIGVSNTTIMARHRTHLIKACV